MKEPAPTNASPLTREAERNRSLAAQTNPAGDTMLFPSLEPGVTVLDIEGSRGVPVLQSLVLDHLLLHDGPAFWVDADGHATTTTLAQLAPSQRLLARVQVARGFTAYQHYGAITELPDAAGQVMQDQLKAQTNTQQTSTAGTDTVTPSLIVAPAVDLQYRRTDTLRDEHANALHERVLDRLAEYGEGYDVPVLLTRSRQDTFTRPIEQIADRQIRCEQTRLGPRFVGEEFETLVYPVGDGGYYQTTFAYWRQLLQTRATQLGLDTASDPTPTAAADIGAGVTTSGEQTTAVTDPLTEAWTTTADKRW